MATLVRNASATCRSAYEVHHKPCRKRQLTDSVNVRPNFSEYHLDKKCFSLQRSHSNGSPTMVYLLRRTNIHEQKRSDRPKAPPPPTVFLVTLPDTLFN